MFELIVKSYDFNKTNYKLNNFYDIVIDLVCNK